jgi:two-component system phosphate regulon sensor histidine kinase PhoR
MAAEMGGLRWLVVLATACVAAAAAAVLVDRVLRSGLPDLSLPVAAGCGLVIGLLATVPTYRSARDRLRRLSRATRALAQGDFDAPLPPPADDELGELQRAWKRMRLAMEEQVSELLGEAGRQRLILEGMAEGVALLQDGDIVMANPAFAELIGATGPLDGKTPLEAARIPALAEVIDESTRIQAEVSRELVAQARTLRVTARPLGGRLRRMVVVLLDMTEARRLERLRRDFVANASHELRTPVAAILAAAETLAAGAADDASARASFVDILGRHAQRLSRLTADLLDLARLEAGYRPRVEVVPVQAVIEAVMPSLQPRAAEKPLTLETELAPPADGDFTVAAERAAVEQVLSNLVDNAIKYTPAGGRVRVAARALPGLVELVVADTGPGIPAEHLPRLFERFYRVDNARSRELGGTGLGLSIVKHLVAAHGGEVRVESEVGHGTRFLVLLPRPNTSAKSSHESHQGVENGR